MCGKDNRGQGGSNVHSQVIVALDYYHRDGQKGSVRDTIALVKKLLCQNDTIAPPEETVAPAH